MVMWSWHARQIVTFKDLVTGLLLKQKNELLYCSSTYAHATHRWMIAHTHACTHCTHTHPSPLRSESTFSIHCSHFQVQVVQKTRTTCMPHVVEADVYKQPFLRGSPKPSTGGPTIAVRNKDTLSNIIKLTGMYDRLYGKCMTISCYW